MSTPHRNRLWNPGYSIRFSPTADVRPLYPFLDMPRFLHNAGPDVGDSSRSMDDDLNYFSDDEQFERDISEWLDQNEALLAPAPLAEDSSDLPSVTADGSGVDSIAGQKLKAEAGREILPPVTSIDYTISDELFRAALNSKKESPGSFWSHTMYRRTQEDGSVQNVRVHYCTNKVEMEHACKMYFLGEEVLGFDLEWMAWARSGSSVRESVSLIQIASPSRIGLFHVAVFPKDDYVAPTFRQIMESDRVSKVGVNIRGDCTRLKKALNVDTKGIFELSHLYKLVKYCKTGELNRINKSCVAMATQVQDVLRLPLYKGPSVRTSNWMNMLSESQINYSASDAYAGIQLYYALEYERQELDPCPPRPEFSEKGMGIKVAPAEEVDTDVEVELSESEATDITQSDMESRTTKAMEGTAHPEPFKANDKIREAESLLAAADLEAKQYRSRKGQLTAKPNAIKIYYLWHSNDGLSPTSITEILPLKKNTVVTYILEAISLESLPYSKDRLRNEVLSFLNPNTVLPDKELMGELRELQKASK